MPGNPALLLDFADGKEHLLRTAYRERGNHNISTPIQRALDDGCKLRHGVERIAGILMEAVAVGRFHDQIIRIGYIGGIFDDRLVKIADIAAEDYFSCLFAFGEPELDAGGAEQMAGVDKTNVNTVIHCFALVVIKAPKQLHGALGIFQGIDRLDQALARAFGFTALPLRFRLLNVRGIRQHNGTEVSCGSGGIDRAAIAVFIQLRKHAGMVNMRMGEENAFDLSHADGNRNVFKNVSPLLHPAIDKVVFSVDFQKSTASRYLMQSADERDLHDYQFSCVFY